MKMCEIKCFVITARHFPIFMGQQVMRWCNMGEKEVVPITAGQHTMFLGAIGGGAFFFAGNAFLSCCPFLGAIRGDTLFSAGNAFLSCCPFLGAIRGGTFFSAVNASISRCPICARVPLSARPRIFSCFLKAGALI